MNIFTSGYASKQKQTNCIVSKKVNRSLEKWRFAKKKPQHY